MISAAYEPPPDFQPMTYQDLPPPPPDEGFYEAQPFYAFDAFGPPPLPPPPEYYPHIFTLKMMIGAIAAAAAAGRYWLSAGAAGCNSARGRRDRVPTVQLL